MEYYSGGTLMQALGSDSQVLGWRQRITLSLQVGAGGRALVEVRHQIRTNQLCP
jgi:hypothetical protein